ncbi:bifunctional diguanylate cyclase/phosphodiesterase [Piscinibacter sp. XHJ-5]|uniref:putative bifunctional diguanylate cyclase/phosphodiesterase n=1 Tax=Piscinibacter sp. XHJ-5 TaxID=3037797 RepID=UPI002452F0B9|nr:bifunctional diguanylate cyclase/phosphodiesterase [Piscinibacter sp. XHJ-5]
MDLDLVQRTAIAAAVALTSAGFAAVWMWRRRRGGMVPVPAMALDPATGLLTRSRFQLALQEGLLLSAKRGTHTCVLHVAVDGVRLAVDDGGPALAARMLAAIATLLRQSCGLSTPMARVGNDEFAIWLDGPQEAGEKLAARITQAFAVPLSVDGRDVELVVSVGLAVAPEHDAGVRLLDKAAATARSVQRSGGGAHAVFDPRIEVAHNQEIAIARELHEAGAKRQLELFFQPKIDARKLEVSAVEALLRWRHPTMGLVSPARFIPIAERQGLMEALGQWVLDGAIKQAAAWRAAGLRFRVAVNISGVHFRQDDFVAKLERGLKAHGLPAELLTCEVAEAVLMEKTAANRHRLARLQKLGVQLSVGDFAAGPASLSALESLPAHEVKVSRGLVAALPADAEARRTVEKIVAVAHQRGLRVVGEGVENEAQRDQAVRLGCDELQGYLFAKPMSARAVGIWGADAQRNLAQTFRPAQFKDTQIVDVRASDAAFVQTRISMRR